MILPVYIFATLLIPKSAHALTFFGLEDAGYWLVGKTVYAVAYIISFIAGLGIAIEAWALQIILDLSSQIVTSVPVKYGFPASLALANLGFILAIAIIAIMTVLRFQSYGLKQVLWKLVVMAIMVNFGLVIASAILQVPDSLTKYFLDQINPGVGENSFTSFSGAVAGAFNPQKSFSGAFNVDAGDANAKDLTEKFANAGSDLGKMLAPISSLIFTVFFLLAVVLTLGAAVVMLIVRYVYIGYLLILLPLAWASWIFPITQNQWSKWWGAFLKQAFFPVFLVFFLWLAVLTSKEMSLAQGYHFANYISDDTGPWGAISNLLSNFLAKSAILPLMQGSIVIGIAIAGLFTAQALGITFAKTAMGAFNSATTGFGKAVGGWAGRRGKQAATYPLRTERMKGWASKLQNAPLGKLGKYTGLNLGASYLGGGLQRLAAAGSEGSVADAEKRLKDRTDEELANMMSRATAPERVHILQRLHKNKNLVGMVQNLPQYMDENLFKRYNQGLAFGVMKGESGFGLTELIKKDEDQLKKDMEEILRKSNRAAEIPAMLAKTREEVLRMLFTEQMKRAGDTAHLAKTFFASDEKLQAAIDQGRLMGIGSLKEVKALQQEIMGGMALGSSGSAISKFYQEAARGDQLEVAAEAMRNANVRDADIAGKASEKYFDSSGAKNLGIDKRGAGVKP